MTPTETNPNHSRSYRWAMSHRSPGTTTRDETLVVAMMGRIEDRIAYDALDFPIVPEGFAIAPAPARDPDDASYWKDAV